MYRFFFYSEFNFRRIKESYKIFVTQGAARCGEHQCQRLAWPSLVQVKADLGLRVLLEQPPLIAFRKTHANQLAAFS